MVAPVAAPRANGPGISLVRTVSTPRYLEERESGSEESTVSHERERLWAPAAAAATQKKNWPAGPPALRPRAGGSGTAMRGLRTVRDVAWHCLAF